MYNYKSLREDQSATGGMEEANTKEQKKSPGKGSHYSTREKGSPATYQNEPDAKNKALTRKSERSHAEERNTVKTWQYGKKKFFVRERQEPSKASCPGRRGILITWIWFSD